MQLCSLLLAGAHAHNAQIKALQQGLHEAREECESRAACNESLREQLGQSECRLEVLEREIISLENVNHALKDENEALVTGITTLKDDQERLMQVSDRFKRSRQSFSNLMQSEKSTFDSRLRELEDQLAEEKAERGRLERANGAVLTEKERLEWRLSGLVEDLKAVQFQRVQEEQLMERMLEDKMEIIDSLGQQLALKDQEIRHLLLRSSEKQELKPAYRPSLTLHSSAEPHEHMASPPQTPFALQVNRFETLSLELEEEGDKQPPAPLTGRSLQGPLSTNSRLQPRQRFIFSGDIPHTPNNACKVEREVQTDLLYE